LRGCCSNALRFKDLTTRIPKNGDPYSVENLLELVKSSQIQPSRGLTSIVAPKRGTLVSIMGSDQNEPKLCPTIALK
jgi:hypothetical protein